MAIGAPTWYFYIDEFNIVDWSELGKGNGMGKDIIVLFIYMFIYMFI